MSEFNTRKIPQELANSVNAMANLLAHIDKIHTTPKGAECIQRNLQLDTSSINAINAYCKSKIADKKCRCCKWGKNYYCEIDDIRLTINYSSYIIITARFVK